MSEPSNGTRAILDFHSNQIEKLWNSKASNTALENVSEDVKEIKDELKSIREGLEARQEAAVKERKSDRKWMVGTALAAASLVLGGLALILPYLQ